MSQTPALEFDCAECGEHIISIGHSHFPLCAKCVHMPGWFKVPALRDILSPEHDGREAGQWHDADEVKP